MALPPTLTWIGSVDGHLDIIDQRLLPTELKIVSLYTLEEVFDAIKTLAIRGAPAIGLTAAYGMVIAARTISPSSQSAVLIQVLIEAAEYLKQARPTAVNLEWAVTQMLKQAIAHRAVGVRSLMIRLLEEAQKLHADDRTTCHAIGEYGQALIPDNAKILTHCNAGALACSEFGTALSPMYAAWNHGKRFQVFADETRPLLQGSRLTAWELAQSGVDVTVICDNMAAWLMKKKGIDLVIVGADRIAANGDTANKIGTYGLALVARAHHVPFYVAAPSSTFDLSLKDGGGIPIEERAGDEITYGMGRQTAPHGVKAFNPAFDVTPAELITGIITENGLIAPVNREKIREMMGE